MQVLKRMLYTTHPDKTHRVFPGRPWPSSSAVKYIVAVRMPAIPATKAMPPTLRTSCNSPMPSAPIREDRNT